MKTKLILLIVLLSPVLGELLSGSAPPVEFFNPFGFFILVAFYGGSTLLIREARVRWGLQWSVVLLAIAYGIIEEGVMMQSFFNFNHADLGVLSHYGEFFGIHVPWTISLILYHATISTLIPLAMVDFIWPSYKTTSLLSKRGIIATMLIVLIPTVLLMMVVWQQQADFAIPYEPNPVLLIGCLVVIGILCWVAYYFRDHVISTKKIRLLPSWVFGIVGFLLYFWVLFFTNICAETNLKSVVTIGLQVVGIILLILFGVFQLLHKDSKISHVSNFIVGSLLFFIVITPIHEFTLGSVGMLPVGILSGIMLFYWRRIIGTRNQMDMDLRE